MKWNHLFKAIRFVFTVTFAIVLVFGVFIALIVYVPPLISGILFFVGFFWFLIHVQYNHYKRIDEIEASHKKWKSERDKNWDKITPR